MNKRRTGSVWEAQAAQWLLSRGYQVLEKNFRCKFGEVDLIAFREETFIFVEVKYRKSAESGFAQETVPMLKQKRISATADYYRMKHGITEKVGFRFDVIAVNNGVISHYENAFPYRGKF